MFPTNELTASGYPTIITDQLAAPADFLLHRTITTHLKTSKKNRCILLSTSSDLPRWKAVSAKQNVNIDQHIKSGSFKFVDLVSCLQPPQQLSQNTITADAPEPTSLRSLFDLIKDYIEQIVEDHDDSYSGANDRDPGTIVVFDDTSSFEWLGHPTTNSTRFIRALTSLCRKSNSSLLFRHHIVSGDEPDDLLRQLLQIVAYHVDVRPLSSGKSGAVSGEISLHPGPVLVKSSIRLITRSQALQYRLTDYGAVFFDKGTGGGIL